MGAVGKVFSDERKKTLKARQIIRNFWSLNEKFPKRKYVQNPNCLAKKNILKFARFEETPRKEKIYILSTCTHAGKFTHFICPTILSKQLIIYFKLLTTANSRGLKITISFKFSKNFRFTRDIFRIPSKYLNTCKEIIDVLNYNYLYLVNFHLNCQYIYT